MFGSTRTSIRKNPQPDINRSIHGPIRVRPETIKYIDIMLLEATLRALLDENEEEVWFTALFRGINPNYPQGSYSSSFIGIISEEWRYHDITTRMAEALKMNPSLSCVIQFRFVTISIDGNSTRLPYAICTVFDKGNNPQQTFITDDQPLIP